MQEVEELSQLHQNLGLQNKEAVDTVAEGRLRSSLYKVELYLIKVIPVLTAVMALLNTILSFVFDIDAPIISYIGGVSIFTLLFFYLSSYVFKFCVYHRMFIHYITFNWLLNIYDYYIGVPLNNRNMFALYLIVTGIFMLLILYYHQKEVKIKRETK